MGYDQLVRQLAASEKLEYVGCIYHSGIHIRGNGPEKTALLFLIDHNQTSPEGAEINSRSAVMALRKELSSID